MEKEKDEKYHGQGKVFADKWTDGPRRFCKRSDLNNFSIAPNTFTHMLVLS